MRIPNKLLEEWKNLKSPSDAREIANGANFSRQTVYRAFDLGECNDEVFEAIAKFYKEKQEKVDAFLSDFQD